MTHYDSNKKNFIQFKCLSALAAPLLPKALLRHFLFTWLKKQGIDDALIQPYSGHESRKSLEIYSKLSISDAQTEYEENIGKFPI